MKCFVFLPLNNIRGVMWQVSERLTCKVLRKIIPLYPHLNVMFFKFVFIHKTFLVQVCFSMIYLNWQNFAREK